MSRPPHARRTRGLVFTLGGAACLALMACDGADQTTRAEAQWRTRQAAIDPPQLWSVQVVGEAHNGWPVLICADSELRSGFTSVIPAHGALHCAREVATTPTRPTASYRCTLNGAEYAVSSRMSGDRARDFETDSTILRIEDGASVYARTLRFRQLGACPAGWNVGDTTNQKGQHLSGAVERP